ncbi:receptor-type tyrosine-protein phosphatase F-like, partial [Stylophora pistillata]|uniref:receptor-type tyrosine-protein phosphatase F-like n=1 Tax=Stylophora pistillata TaxID=50429 RepID=UPI000C048C75
MHEHASAILENPKNAIIVEGEEAVLSCVVDGNPSPKVTWTKNEEKLNITDVRLTASSQNNNHSLTITNVYRSDSGQYRCVALNNVGNLTSTLGTLTVQFAPEFSSSPQNVIVIEENKVTVTLNCTVFGNPTPDVKWTKDEIELSKNERINVSEIVGNISSLTITNTVREDEGQYRCVANNSVNTSTSSPGKLTVNFRADVLISGSEPKFVEISKQIQLTCQYNASPPVLEVQWVKDGNAIARNESGIGSVTITQFTESQSQLIISSSTKQDEGTYTCFVTNAVGNSSNATSVLIQVVPDPPQNITVDSKGSRVVNISWTPGSSGNSDIKNYTVEISENNQNFNDVVCQGSLSNGTCVVSSPSTTASLTGLFPWTTYNIRVFATNKIGGSNSSPILDVTTDEEVPSEAPSFVVTVVNSTAVNVSWQMLSKDKARGEILGYYVLYRVNSTPPWINKTVDGAEMTSLLVGSLNEHTTYEFAMQAFNSKGASDLSALLEKTTDQHKPSGPPQQVTISEVTSTTVKVDWNPVLADDRNGIIQGYRVNYQALPDGETLTESLNINSGEQGEGKTIVLMTLSEFTNYSISVLAFTEVGNGPKSGAQVVETLEDKPGGPPEAVTISATSSKNLSVSWDPVIAENRNGIIKGYKVNYQALPSSDIVSKFRNITSEEQNDQQTVILDNLNEFTNYSIRVLAFTVIGNGRESDAQVVETLEDKPAGRPQAVTVNAASSKNISVSWDPVIAGDRNGIIKGYEVNYRALPSDDTVSKFRNITSEEQNEKQTVILDDLNEFTNYSIRVLAFTVIGNGPESDAQVVETLEDKPNRSPEIMAATATSSKNISVSWDPVPSDNRNGIIKGYKVNYQALPSGDIVSKFRNITSEEQSEKQTVILDNLNEFTNYSIRVLAFTVIGNGPESGAQVVETLQDKPNRSPEAVTATAVSSKNISVSWDPVVAEDRNGIIQGYKVNYQALPSGDMVSKFRNITSEQQNEKQTFILDNLNEFTNYSIRVLAFTVIGNGLESGAQVVETLEDKPKGFPEAVAATAVSPKNISVSWDPVIADDRNGIIKGYKVNYRALPSGKMVANFRNITSEEQTEKQTVILENLNEFTNYSISVLAFTDVGNGPESGAQIVETLQDKPNGSPGALTATAVSSQNISVSWDPVIADDRNGIIKGYKVNYQALPSGDMVSKFRNITSEEQNDNQTVVLDDLNEFTKYRIRVLAFTVIGNGPESGAQVVETLEDKPTSSPEAVTAIAASSQSISVSWDPVITDDRNGIIKGYRVNYQALPGGDMIYKFHNITSDKQDDKQTVILENLNEFTNYSISVLAFTVIGNGLGSGAQVVQTREDKPNRPPEAVSASAVSSKNISVSWDPVLFDDRNGIIKGYKVNYQTLPSGHVISMFRNITNEDQNENQTVILDNLNEFTNYSIRVLAFTVIGNGQESGPRVVETLEDKPSSAPRNLSLVNTTSTSIFVEWDAVLLDEQNGIIISYNVSYQAIHENGSGGRINSTLVNAPKMFVNLTGLTKDMYYNISVLASTRVGDGIYSSPEKLRTNEDRPSGPPQRVEGQFNNSTSISVTWDDVPEDQQHGDIISYTVMYRKLTEENFKKIKVTSKSAELVELEKYTMYRIEVLATTRVGNGPLSEPIMQRTDEDKPEKPPQSVNVTTKDSSSIEVEWGPVPEKFRHGIITKYIILYNYSSEGKPSEQNEPRDALKTVVRGLKQSTKYTIQILAATVKGRGPPSDPKFATTEDPPEPPKVVENNVGKTEVSIPFKPKQELSNGHPVSKYQVIVMELAEGQDPGKSSDPKYIKVTRKYEEKVAGEPYITAEFANNNEERTSFPVGDGKYYSTDGVTEDKRKRREVVVRYLNGKLNDGAEYVAFQRSFDREGVYESEGFVDFKTEKDHTVTIVVVVVVLVIVIAVIGGGIFFYRRRHSQPGNGEEELALRPQRRGRTLSKKILGRASGAFDNPIHNPGESVPVEDFDEHVRRLHANGDLLFSQEYGSLRPQADFTWNATLAQENRHKNRYNNIVAYDHSRVKLSPIQGVPGSDYINANFLDGYQRKKAYIASQGPLPETEDDFWRMIWEQDSKTIVMVTNLEERGRIKCHQYWPSEGGKTYGDVQVAMMQTVELSDFTIRTFTLKKANSRTERTLNQYHYTIWPDHGVPSCPTSLLTFVKKASGANPSDAGPMVVHCSAGVGRTGTFVVVDAMLQRIAAEKTVDVFGYVMTLRRDRNIMVQVEEQYVFIHEVLLEAIHSGYTEIRANDLRSHMKLLMQVSPTTGQTEMDEEFIRLGRGNAPQSKFQAANMSYNKTKNRYANVLAFDDTRVKLSMITGIEGSDYINANFIDGYMTRRAFIATQAPIPD